MSETKQQSNPFSTGSGGPNFETRVQAAFAVFMLTGGPIPCLPLYPIEKIKLQGRYAGFNTDDLIVYVRQEQTGQEAKLLAQIKHTISITASDSTFSEVIQSFWDDFTSETFDSDQDVIALITGPLAATNINHVRPILEWARHSENETEFLGKVNTHKFSHEIKREKLKAFKKHLKSANGGTDISDKQLWKFLRVFHLIGYDLDTESGGTLSLIYSLISYRSHEQPSLLWTSVVDAIQTANQNAGTITLKTIPKKIRSAFNPNAYSDWSSDIGKFHVHGDYILNGIRTTVGDVHIDQSENIAQLFDLTEASDFVLVSGRRGTRKSSLIRNFSDLAREHAPLFCLRTEDLDESHLDKVFSAMNLKGSLNNLESGFALFPNKYLIIESLEKLLELSNTSAFTDLLRLLKKHQGWKIIATCREYAYQQITFNFLQPSGVGFETLIMDEFSDAQVQELCGQNKAIQKFSENPALRSLLSNPFFADLAFRVLETGTTFSPGDSEKEFRSALWRDVIAKEQVRKNGMPSKRKRAFIDIAVTRAKQMTFGVPESNFDSDVILKLEEDNLVRRDINNSLVMPAHDVLEDWALEQYIEDAFHRHSHNIPDFLNEIGSEPAINRAFRLWLHQNLRYGENVQDLVYSVLIAHDIERYWQDETITAVLQGDNPDVFLESLKEQLFTNDGALLKRFCFILRIACQAPDSKISGAVSNEGEIVDTLSLKPYGQGWNTFIFFLLENKELLSASLTTHVAALLKDWSSVLQIDNQLEPPIVRATGLLALHLLEDLKESYRNEEVLKKLLGVIIKSHWAVKDEFSELMERDVFTVNIIPADRQPRSQRQYTGLTDALSSVSSRRQKRPRYVSLCCEMLFLTVDTAYLCRHDPDLLVKLALFEWFIQEPTEDENLWNGSRIDVAECFGLHEHKYNFSPASGAKGPFLYLLAWHPRKGLDFIIELLNKAADKYAHSDLEYPQYPSHRTTEHAKPQIEQVEIQLNDGSSVKQYCSVRLWQAYRGHSVVPELLLCALMAFENWLISYVEKHSYEKTAWLFDYVLRHSNSVMSTAVLASVATGYPEKVGKAALPLLSNIKLYYFDMERTIKERGDKELNWHGIRSRLDPLATLYTKERHTAAMRPWRRKDLETLALHFQFSEYREDMLDTIDRLRKSTANDDRARFLFHRIDSREFTLTEDKENNRIQINPKELEPDLEETHQKTEETKQSYHRFLRLDVWSKEIFERKPLEKEYYKSWREAFVEAKELLKQLEAGEVSDLEKMHYGGIVTASAIFLRDYSENLTKEEALWCAGLVVHTVTVNADTDDTIAFADATDSDGAAASAYVLPILLDFACSDEEKLVFREVIVIALTHANEHVRNRAADGIREYLWQRNADFAQICISGALAYARLEKKWQQNRKPIYLMGDNEKEIAKAKLQTERDTFRDQFARGELSNDMAQITLQTYSPWHILAPSLMVPDDSTELVHIKLLSQMLALFIEVEHSENNNSSGRDRGLKINFDDQLHFVKRFGKHLLHLHHTDFEAYIEQLRSGCKNAPRFIVSLIYNFAVIAENENQEKIYWQLWEKLSGNVQEIAVNIGQGGSAYRKQGDCRQLIRGMLLADIDWSNVNLENNQLIAVGKDLILQFAENVGKNPDVFEAMAKYMFHCPHLYFEPGLHILSKHQNEEDGTRLFSGVNTSFYLERSIQRFLQIEKTGPLQKDIYEACLVLLNVIVETASSRAYYLREHIVKSRKIQN